MKKRLYPLAAALLCSASLLGTAFAADAERQKREPTPAQLAQRERMKNCSAEAKAQALKGDPRKAFMRACLARGSGQKETPADAGKPLQKPSAADGTLQKAAACQQEAKAKALAGEEAKQFISRCLM
jgi:hypothetical protein